MSFTWQEIISKLNRNIDLATEETTWAMDQVMSGETSPVILSGFLMALTTKGETAPEVLGLANSMQNHAEAINLDSNVIDIVGTGGDRLRTVNISTMAAIVVAACGLKVVKHGNRASTSKSGAADCLEALGVDLNLDVNRIEEVFSEIGMAFLFANKFHPSMKYAAAVRRELAIPTVFNILGPLTNPARPQVSVIGVYSAQLAPVVAEVLAARGSRALVFRGENGLDELSAVSRNQVWEIRNGEVVYSEFDATEVGIDRASIDDIHGADAQYNASVVHEVLEGKRGAVRDAVVLNAAGAIVADGSLVDPESGSLVDRLKRACELAYAAIDDGRARQLLNQWIELTR